jgi:hypothetical protein
MRKAKEEIRRLKIRLVRQRRDEEGKVEVK